MKRRLIFRAGGATWLPPEEFGESAYKSARFSLFNGATWLLLALGSVAIKVFGADTDGDRLVQLVLFRTALYGFLCAMTSYVAARFKSWSALRCYTFFAGLQIMFALMAVLTWLLLNMLGWLILGDWLVVLVCVHTYFFVTAISTVVLMNGLNEELDPQRQRREYRRQRRRARNERRRLAEQQQAQDATEPAVAPPRGDVAGVVVPQATGMSLRQFLGTLQLEALHDTISGMGVTSVEQLSLLDEQACVAQGMLPLQVRRLQRIADEHLEQRARDRAIQGSVVGFTTANEAPFSRGAATGTGLSAGLLGEIV
jgi:hypothetical protein|eukprot:COSAG03_NODE_3068_length_2250_cov_1.757787_3_plen_312_part_00